ncbi:hypothetical protein [Tychonema sp. LEGE 06208]|uniref:hypothetical protein n=1 Tax=Tychonema sp. LEGE 06208 TaxID=1828663 RepID=UPI00187F3CB8|nr:hypothetical protein [Tychonema sp. LEGE 06208]MBE9163319.1 hypothetical protein [Tychonema sp. LEGE 06208]
METERGFTASGDEMLSSQKVNFSLHDRVIFVNVPIEWVTSLGQEGDGRSSSQSSAHRDRCLS